MKARILLILETNNDKDELGWEEAQKINVIEFHAQKNERQALEEFLRWKHLMERWYLISNVDWDVKDKK